jgi:FkbM family methyltransferase
MIGRRGLKKLAARLLPEAVKAPLRGRLYGYRPAAVRPPLRFEEDGDGLTAVLDGGVRLRMKEALRGDLLFHFETNGASVEEMEGFRRVAAEEGGLLFDVGAHRCLFAHLFCLARPGNRAVAYEPSPELISEGRALAALNALGDRIVFREAAVAAAPGRMRTVMKDNGFFEVTEGEVAGGVDVELTTLDAECERMGAVPDVVKIDIEGAEFDALLGGRALFRSRKPVLFLELHYDLLETRGVRPRDVSGELERFGYRFFTPLGRPLSRRESRDPVEAISRIVAR